MVELQDMVECATDTTSESLVFGAIKAADEDHQSIDLCEFQANLLGLRSNILDRFAAIYPNDFIFSWVLQELE